MVLLAAACMAKEWFRRVQYWQEGSCRRATDMQAQETDLTLASPGSGVASGWSLSIHGCALVGTRAPFMLLSADGLHCELSMSP